MNDLLYLDILNLTVDAQGNTSGGYAPSDIYLIIQGRIKSGDGAYGHFDWNTGTLKPMALADNTHIIDLLGVNPDTKYAPYWITLEDLMKKSYYDATKGLPIPTPIFSGRLYISFETPVYINVSLSKTGAIGPAEPDEGSSTDPNYYTIWDKFEFTADGFDKLYSNTTCVDFVGIPMAYSVNGAAKPQQGFDSTVASSKDPFGTVVKNFKADPDFAHLVQVDRLFAPKVNSAAFSPFGKNATFMDKYINFCWAHYFSNTAPIKIWNYVDITMLENSSLRSDDDGKGCKWEAEGVMVGGNAKGTAGVITFTITALHPKNGNYKLTPPTTSFTIAHPSSWDTLRQGGVFAPITTGHAYEKAIDGDIKNQVSSALNRNVMHGEFLGDYDITNPAKGTIFWADRNAYYEDNKVPATALCVNKYGKFLHELSLDNLCYALAYDDKYGQNVNLTADLSATKPTVMKLSVYYQKPKLSGGSFPSATVKATDFLGNNYTISIVQNPKDKGQMLMGIKAANSDVLENIVLMYVPEGADPDKYDKYVPGPATNGLVKVPVRALEGGFRFAFRFEIQGDVPSGREFLLPPDVNATNGNVYVYDPTNTTNPVSTVTIAN